MTDFTQKEGAASSAEPVKLVVLGVVGLVAVFFWFEYATVYFSWSAEAYGPHFWPERVNLIFHIMGGTLALLIGPVQLWMGLKHKYMHIHKKTGLLYLGGVALGVIAGVTMLPNAAAEYGMHFAIGLGSLALVWAVTGSMAYYAIRKHNYEQHMEWMIRSYIVTFAFASFRLIDEYVPHADWGMTQVDFVAMLSWTVWAIPLLVTEAIIQARKI